MKSRSISSVSAAFADSSVVRFQYDAICRLMEVDDSESNRFESNTFRKGHVPAAFDQMLLILVILGCRSPSLSTIHVTEEAFIVTRPENGISGVFPEEILLCLSEHYAKQIY